MKIGLSWIRRLLPKGGSALKVAGITVLALIAMSGPVFATSAVLIPYLTIIQQVISDQLSKTVSEGFKKTTDNLIKSQVEQFTKELTAKMMPGAFCESDIAKTVAVGTVARATGLDEAKGVFSVTGADTIVNGQRALGQLPAYNPTAVIAQHNREVRAFTTRAASKSNNCSPIQAIPVDLSGSNVTCTQEERRVAAAVLLGASPPAELPNAQATGAMGQVYESARTTSIGRKQLAALALADAGSDQKQAFISGVRELLGKASVDQMNAQTGTGGVQRDSVALQRIQAQLLLESYVEKIEQKRLAAIVVAQQAESDDREVLSALRRRQ